MKLGKQLIFICLLLSFFVYSVAIYTIGTSDNRSDTLFTKKAKKGKEIFHKYNCIACHQIYGLGGYMGPDLTNIISNNNNGEIIARAFLQSGTNKMPNFNLDKEEIDALISYLNYLDQSSTYPLTNFEINYTGTVDVKDKK